MASSVMGVVQDERSGTLTSIGGVVTVESSRATINVGGRLKPERSASVAGNVSEQSRVVTGADICILDMGEVSDDVLTGDLLGRGVDRDRLGSKHKHQ